MSVNFGVNAAGGNTSATNAGKMQVTTTKGGQAMVARVLRAKARQKTAGAQFDGVTAGDSLPHNAAFSSSSGPSDGYIAQEGINTNMDYSGKHKKTQRNPSRQGGGIA